MNLIVFKTPGYKERYNPETGKSERIETFAVVEMEYSDVNVAIAREKAHNGEYSVEELQDQ